MIYLFEMFFVEIKIAYKNTNKNPNKETYPFFYVEDEILVDIECP